jgi:hypothetical protein
VEGKAPPWLRVDISFSRRAITLVWLSPRVEPGVTVWSRAGSKWALPRSCIYRCPSSQHGWKGVRSTPNVVVRTVPGSDAIDRDLVLWGEGPPSMAALRKSCRSQQGGSRRDAGLVGASLSADVPLTTIVAHMFYLSSVGRRLFSFCFVCLSPGQRNSMGHEPGRLGSEAPLAADCRSRVRSDGRIAGQPALPFVTDFV